MKSHEIQKTIKFLNAYGGQRRIVRPGGPMLTDPAQIVEQLEKNHPEAFKLWRKLENNERSI